jgi:hypothetical protein
VLAVRSAAVLVTAGTAPPVAIGCATAAAAWTVWLVLWTMPVTAETGADGDATWDAGPMLADEAGALTAGTAILTAGALTAGAAILTAGAGAGAGALVAGAGEFAAAVAGRFVLAAGAVVPFVVFWPAGAGWAVGCAVATVRWTVSVAPWTTPLTAAAVAAEAVVWVAALAPDAVVAAGALAAGALPAAAAAAVDPAVDPAGEATDDTAEVADETTGGTAVGFCAADAGRAKITVRIKPSMKVRARPPPAYKHARRVQPPTFVSPTLKRMGTFPSTARKLRETLRYLTTAPELVTRR